MSEQERELDELIDAVIDDRCDEASLRRFERLVGQDPRARQAYLDQVRMHALLEWHYGLAAPHTIPAPAPARRVRRWVRHPLPWGLAAVALIGALAILALRSTTRVRGGDVATVIDARNVVWYAAEHAVVANARLAPRAVRYASGTLRLAFATGAVVTVEGPADFRIVSGARIKATRGRITARLAEGAKGFTVETPTSVVVDQGTAFGVQVDASGQTDVVVFEGLVDLAPRHRGGGEPGNTRLVQGEGVRVDTDGRLNRIVAVEHRPGEDGWSTEPRSGADAVIRSVRDNIRGLESAKYYQIVHHGLDDDAPAYVDRPHEWNGLGAGGLPEFLRGADYIMPFNDDKWVMELEISVELTRAATLYVFLDNREKQPQPWLKTQFTDTGVRIGLDEGTWPDPSPSEIERGPGRSINQMFSVWKRDVDGPGSVRLGALQEGKSNRAMYGIAAVARP